MYFRKLSLCLALGALPVVGCGDDAGDESTTTQDSAVNTASTTSDAAVADAKVADAAAPATDSGAKVDSGVRPVDGGVKDSAIPAKPDGAVTQVPDAGASAGESAACTSCTATECLASKWPDTDPMRFKSCSDFGTEKAEAGRKMGTPKSQLCQAATDCMARTGCGDRLVPTADHKAYPDAFGCVCGDLDLETCMATNAASDFKGPCVAEFMDAAETVTPLQLAEHLIDPAFALGVVVQRYQCQEYLCADECFDPCKGQPDGASCNGGLGMPAASAPLTCSNQKCLDWPAKFAD